MPTRYRSKLIASTSVLAIALSTPHLVWAEEAKQEAQSSRLEEITVTARRVEENIQRVPTSVIAISEDRLTQQNVVDLKDFQKVTPGFNTAGGIDGSFAFMRGQQGIASYFGDVPYTLAVTGQYFDVGAIQVLKGPQGTLFGTSSASGAIVVNPKKPGNTVGGFAAVTLGDYGRRTIEGAIDLPAVEDKLLIRLAAQSFYRKGYMIDAASGKDYNNENYYIIRPSVIFRPTDNVENYTMLQYYYARQRTDGAGIIIDYDTANLFTTGHGLWGTLVDLLHAPGTADSMLSQSIKHPYLIPNGITGPAVALGFAGIKERQIFIVNNTRWEITDNLALTNIFSYRTGNDGYNANHQQYEYWNDGFFGFAPNDPRAIQTRTGPLFMQKTWSDEVKFTGKLFDGLIDFTLGTFHQANPAKGAIQWDATTGALTAHKTNGDPRVPARSRAVYGQAEVDLGKLNDFLDDVTFTAGYRNTWNTVSSARTNYCVNDPCPNGAGGFFPAGTGALGIGSMKSSQDFYGRVKFSDNNWLVGLRYQYTPDTMFFVTGSKGVTTGSIDPSFPKQYQVTNPESLKQIEGGVKSTFFLGNLQFRTNASIYYGWYSNIQVTVVHYFQVNAPPAPPTLLTVSENAASGLIRGADFELTVLPTDWFDVNVSGAYNKDKYTNWPVYNADGSFRVNRKRPYLGAPKLKYNITGTFHVPMDEKWGKLNLSATYSHTGRNWYFAGTDEEFGAVPHFSTRTAANGYGPLSADGKVAPRDSDNPFHEVDLNTTWNDAAGVNGLTLSAGVTNLTKNIEGHGTGYAWHAIGLLWKLPAPPRMFTLGVKYAF